MLDFDAAIHDDFESSIFGDLGGFLVDDAQLQPQCFCANLDGLLLMSGTQPSIGLDAGR